MDHFWNKTKKSSGTVAEVAAAAKDAAKDPTSLANLAITLGYVTHDDVKDALMLLKQHPDFIIGQALLKLGKLDSDKLEELVARQTQLRSSGPARSKAVIAEARRAIETTRSLKVKLPMHMFSAD